MSVNTHTGKVCSKAFRGLYNIRQIRKYLSAESTKCLIHAFVTSHLDYCNALLYKLPQYQYDRLQNVLNAAARVTCFILLLEKFLQFDWPRAVVFQLNLKYLHVKITNLRRVVV